ncbi:MAG: dTDP-4-dehydrorhamnose reductase [Elusimicrobia bacterium]|nr:dTDP-4-dehydrorhamnose reductase [Elusimicrobiota bacterium]
MKFLVVGASGFLGRHIFDYLKTKGYEVYGTKNKSDRSDLIHFDLVRESIKEKLPSSIFQTKTRWYSIIASVVGHVDQCAQDIRTSRAINVEGTLQLIENLQEMGSTIIYPSTSWVFNGENGNYKENDSPDPINEYGRQKTATEQCLISKNNESLILRFDKIVGANPHEFHLFSEWNNWIKNNQDVVCLGGQSFSPTFVDDLGPAIEKLCEVNARGLFHIANTEIFSREELATIFLKTLQSTNKIIMKSEKEIGLLERRPRKTYLNSEKFIDLTNFKFTPMQKVINMFKSQT